MSKVQIILGILIVILALGWIFKDDVAATVTACITKRFDTTNAIVDVKPQEIELATVSKFESSTFNDFIFSLPSDFYSSILTEENSTPKAAFFSLGDRKVSVIEKTSFDDGLLDLDFDVNTFEGKLRLLDVTPDDISLFDSTEEKIQETNHLIIKDAFFIRKHTERIDHFTTDTVSGILYSGGGVEQEMLLSIFSENGNLNVILENLSHKEALELASSIRF